jgi:hypothetical protein
MVTKSFLAHDRSIRNEIHKVGIMTIDVLPQGSTFMIRALSRGQGRQATSILVSRAATSHVFSGL